MIHYGRAAGTSFVLDTRGSGVPLLVHWGGDLGPLDQPQLHRLANSAVPAIPPSSIDQPLRLSLLPALGEGWTGRPGITGFRSEAKRSGALRFTLGGIEFVESSSQGIISVAFELLDTAAAVVVTTELHLTAEGVLRLRHRVENRGETAFELGALDMIVPVPDRAREILDFTGLWTHERRPQRTTLGHGLWSRECRHGRPGHDDPFLTVAGTPGFGFRTGEVWATHLAWSGDKRVWAESSPLGPVVLGVGELLAPGEVSVPPGDSYTAPWAVFAYSDQGLDGLSHRLHSWIRSWPSRRSAVRPVVLNTWEAVYFDHDLSTLERLVDAAARVGVERFVLDDGWFTGRSDDRRALGDWFVDARAWPSGLHPLIEKVQAAGMDFGLWVEPEMVSPDSELARSHPDWVLGADSLGPPGRLTWRHQLVLDLGNPAAFNWILGRLDALLTEYPINYLKWDHNRDLLAGSAHAQTVALYRLLDALRARHPRVEIESCASGGARIDLGMLERVDRVWTSDTNDPLERQQIQRFTGVLVPPEYLGGHLGAPVAHTTGRTASLGFRLGTALFGSAGIEWDLTQASPAELAAITEWIGQYKALRPLLHAGVVVHADASDPALELHGVVSPDRSVAVFAAVALAAPRSALPAALRFPGLDPARMYRVRPLSVGSAPRTIQDAPPPWLENAETTFSGTVLARVGLPPALLAPEQVALYSVTAVD
ncbi:alpha-galactosidase [Cryobacterium frigoriphilum]|uniref:alpha-galactosidase n=1 Tax=Cryobacterium frigoriphilum TaxID=1259150 RepID=UPI001F547787|nr:alpha-galactosidase [Cryobacterium frigoriphilum]